MLQNILHLVQKVFISNYPKEWNRQILHAIPKKDHSFKNPDMRGIAIAPLFCRIYDNLIEERFSRWYSPNPEQAGFRKGQGCLIQLFMLNLLIQYAKDDKKNLFVMFLDYAKAFDYANRMKIVKDLIEKGCGSQLTRAIANMYIETEYIPKLKGNSLSDPISTKFGVTQGRKSSAPLYSFYVSDMRNALVGIETSDFMDPFNLEQLADDTAILAETLQSLKTKAEAILLYSEGKLQAPNIKKTFYCNFTEDHINYPLALSNDIKIKAVNEKDGHKYLGMIYYPTNDLNKIITGNITKRMIHVSKFYAWLYVNDDTPIIMKIMVLAQRLFTSLLYAIET